MLTTNLYNLKSKQFNTLNQLCALESSSQISMHLEQRHEVQGLQQIALEWPPGWFHVWQLSSSLIVFTYLIQAYLILPLEEIYCFSLQSSVQWEPDLIQNSTSKW